MPDYEKADAVFLNYYHIDPADLTLPRYWSLLSQIHVVESDKAGKPDHRARVQRMEALRNV